MRWCRGSGWIVLACVVLLATVSTATGFVPHTDDGCPTEIHCTVCRTGLAGIAIPIVVPVLAPVASVEVASPDPLASVHDSDTPRTLALRGPPTI